MPKPMQMDDRILARLFLALFDSPELYPYRTDLSQIAFRSMASPKAYENLPHFDPDSAEIVVALPGVLELISPARGGAIPQFVFMTEYCCSTLLLRCLGALGDTLAINEPFYFASLSFLKRHAMETGAELTGRWFEALKLGLRLFSRTYNSGQNVVIKEWPPTNLLMAELLAANPGCGAVFIYSNLESYLASVLKKTFRRKIARDRVLNKMSESLSYPALSGFTKRQKEVMSDPQIAAFHWLNQMYTYLELQRKPEASRVRSLDCDVFLTHPEETLARAAAHLSIDTDSSEIARVVQGPVFSRYSKPEAPTLEGDFGRVQRDRDISVSVASLGEEVAEGLAWANEILREYPVPSVLPAPLLGTGP